MKELRRLVGAKFPLGFTSFPYVDYHPSLPYSVFLGPGGAEVNMPQVYWRDIGESVATTMKHTWRENRIYGRPIHPIGQTYQSPSTSEILSFRRLAAGYKAPGYSWWEWSTTSTKIWQALGQTLPAVSAPADPGWPLLRRGAKGDPVVRAQQLLASAGSKTLKATGIYDSATVAAVKSFQASNQLTADGQLGATTWVLLGKVTVALARSQAAAAASAAREAAASSSVPQSSTLPAVANEFRGQR
jgi:Putative peptidoglycan binding domain